MDIDDIPLGQNFTAALRENVRAADVVLTVIGPKWLTMAGEDGRRRLDDEHDFVRFEVAEALRQGKRVIPILVNDTPMPKAAELPDDLQPLLVCQALHLADARFNHDATDLIRALGGAEPGPSSVRRWLVAGGIAAALVAIAGWHLIVRDARESPVPAEPKQADADVSGTWEGEVFYEWDRRKVTERFKFSSIAGALTGSASFLGVPRGILSVELKGNTIAFETRTRGSINEKEIEYVHRYRGEVSGDQMRVVMQTVGGHDTGVPREFVARRISRE
jgi:TIR domain